MHPSDLKASPVKIRKTEEGGAQKAWLVSLRGLDAGDVLSMRKLRVFHEASVELDSYMLTREAQVSDMQGPAWLEFAKSSEQKELPTGARLGSRLKLKTVSDLQDEAQNLLEARRQKLREDRGEDEASRLAAAGEDPEKIAQMLREMQGPAAAPSAASMLKTSVSSLEDQPARKKVRKQEPEPVAEDPETADAAPPCDESLDQDMAEVEKKHSEITKTHKKMVFWGQLQVSIALSPQWDGRTLTAAG